LSYACQDFGQTFGVLFINRLSYREFGYTGIAVALTSEQSGAASYGSIENSKVAFY
jgi:hypothetical protein